MMPHGTIEEVFTLAKGQVGLTGTHFVPRSGIPWELLPQEMGCGSGVAC